MSYYTNMMFRVTSKSSIKNPFHSTEHKVRAYSKCFTCKSKLERFGISLLEVLIGITILSFAIGPLVLLFSHANKSLKDDGKAIQALFLTEKVLSEIKAGVNRNPNFMYNVPFGTPFQIINKKTMSRYKGNVPEFLQNIHGYGKTIDSDSPLYEQFENFWIDIQSEYAGRKQFLITVITSWKEKKKRRNIKLCGLVETTPNEFDEKSQ